MHHGGNHQRKQEHKKDGIQNLSNPGHDAAGLQGEQQHNGKKQEGENCQVKSMVSCAQQPNRTHGERSAGAPGNGKQRPNGQIQQAAKEDAVFFAHLVCQRHHALAAAQSQCNNRQHGNAHGGDEYPQKSRQ